MNNRMTVIKSIAICCVIIAITSAVVALDITGKPRYTLEPTEPAETEATTVTETTVETSAPVETAISTETTVEEPATETTAPAETTKPSATAAPTSRPKETAKATTKAAAKKKSTKKSVKKTSRKSSDEDWDGYDDDDAKPTKKPTKKPNTPTPKSYTYCTCDAVVSCGSKAAGTFQKFTLKGLTAHKTSGGSWKLTESSGNRVENYLEKNYPHYGRYSVSVTNRRNYRHKP